MTNGSSHNSTLSESITAELNSRVCPDPVFVIGAPRSGTTVLAWSLAQHSQLWTSGESYILWELFGGDRGATGLDTIFRTAEVLARGSWLTAEQVDRAELLRCLGLGVNVLYSSKSEGKRWIDHTPVQTLMVEVLGVMFPGALFLHVLRDGRSVVSSMTRFMNAMEDDVKANFARAGWTIPWLDFTEACKTWRQYVEAATQFSETHADRCMTVRYDRLVESPWESLSEIFNFLSVPYEEVPLRYIQTQRLHSSQGGQATDPAYGKNGSELWRHWSSQERDIFMREAGPTLLRCGLTRDDEFGIEAL